MITQTHLARLCKLIASGQEHNFYLWPEWKHTVEDVRKLDHGECQYCKARGRYSRGEIVHHVKHLKDRPDLALSIYDPDTSERQLVLICKQCHEEQHPEALRQYKSNLCKPITPECWD